MVKNVCKKQSASFCLIKFFSNAIYTSDKTTTFNINEKNKNLGLLKKIRLRGDFWYGNHFGKVGSYSVKA